MTSHYKDIYWEKRAETLAGLIDEIHYGEYDRAQMFTLREISNLIYPAGADNRTWKRNGFLIGSHPHFIFETLEDAFFEGTVAEAINKLLHLYERYELLAVLVKM